MGWARVWHKKRLNIQWLAASRCQCLHAPRVHVTGFLPKSHFSQLSIFLTQSLGASSSTLDGLVLFLRCTTVLILVYNILTTSSNRLLIIVMCVWWLWWRMSIGFRWICEPCEMVVKVSTALFISVSSLLKRVIFYAPTDPWMPKPNQTRAIF